MAKYKFTQFNTIIVDPTITIDMSSIRDNAIDKLLTVDITLETTTSKLYGVKLVGMSYEGNWIDTDIPNMVSTKLKDFEI